MSFINQLKSTPLQNTTFAEQVKESCFYRAKIYFS